MNTSPHGSGDLFPWEEEESRQMTSASDAASVHIDSHTDGVENDWDDDGGVADLDSDEFDLAPLSRPVAPREYYSISEVCDLVDLKPHVLRYWETQFPVLNPSKNRSGNRVYQRKEIRLILLVKHLLYDEKYTVEGARAKLDQLRRGGTLQDSTRQALEPQMIELLRSELHQLLRILSPQGAGSS